MPYQYTPPKYAQVIDGIQRRIESGEYPPGSMLPSEHQLSEEFRVVRATVARALRILRDDGWIETQQGKGSFVRGRPALANLETQRPGEDALNREESVEGGDLVETEMRRPVQRIATLLGLDDYADVIGRRHLVRLDGKPSELVTRWFPATLAEGTDLRVPAPLPGGIREHLARRKGIRIDHVLEQVVARHPTPREVHLLGVGRKDPMLVLYVTGRDASGSPVLVLEIVMPGDQHELQDAYQVG